MSGPVRTLRSMAYVAFDGVFLEVHPDCAPDDGDWDQFVAWLSTNDLTGLRGLILAEGPGPNAGQRKKLMNVPGVNDRRSIVLTKSIVARGTISALNWIGYKNLKGVDYKNLVGAMEHLGITRDKHRAIAQRFLELKCELLGVTPSTLPADRDPIELATFTFAELHQLLQLSNTRPRGHSAA